MDEMADRLSRMDSLL